MKNKLNCLKSRRSLKAVAADTLIIFDNSRGFDAKYLTHDKLIPPMRWTFCTYHEERREKYQLWIFLLLISTKVNKINPLFQREHMCTKCQILSETSFITETFKQTSRSVSLPYVITRHTAYKYTTLAVGWTVLVTVP